MRIRDENLYNVTPKERYAILKTHDTRNNYTLFKADDELHQMCANIMEESTLINIIRACWGNLFC